MVGVPAHSHKGKRNGFALQSSELAVGYNGGESQQLFQTLF